MEGVAALAAAHLEIGVEGPAEHGGGHDTFGRSLGRDLAVAKDEGMAEAGHDFLDVMGHQDERG